MASLPESLSDATLHWQSQFLRGIDGVSATEFTLLQIVNDPEQADATLEQLQNAEERLRDKYLKLSTLLVKIAEAQPSTSSAVIELFQQTRKVS